MYENKSCHFTFNCVHNQHASSYSGALHSRHCRWDNIFSFLPPNSKQIHQTNRYASKRALYFNKIPSKKVKFDN